MLELKQEDMINISSLISDDEITNNMNIECDIDNIFKKDILKDIDIKNITSTKYSNLVDMYKKEWAMQNYCYSNSDDTTFLDNLINAPKLKKHTFSEYEKYIQSVPKVKLKTLKDIAETLGFCILPIEFSSIEESFCKEEENGVFTKKSLKKMMSYHIDISEEIFQDEVDVFILCPISFYDFWKNVCSEKDIVPYFPKMFQDRLLSWQLILPTQRILKSMIEKNSKEIELLTQDVKFIKREINIINKKIKSLESEVSSLWKNVIYLNYITAKNSERIANNENRIKAVDYTMKLKDRARHIVSDNGGFKKRYHYTIDDSLDAFEFSYIGEDTARLNDTLKAMSKNETFSNYETLKNTMMIEIKNYCCGSDPLLFTMKKGNRDFVSNKEDESICCLGFEWGGGVPKLVAERNGRISNNNNISRSHISKIEEMMLLEQLIQKGE